MYVYLCMYTYVCMCMYLFMYAFTLSLISLPSCMHVYVYVCVFMFVYLWMYVYVCIYVRLHPLLDLLTILRHNVITSNSASSYSIHTPVILQILFLFIHLSWVLLFSLWRYSCIGTGTGFYQTAVKSSCMLKTCSGGY